MYDNSKAQKRENLMIPSSSKFYSQNPDLVPWNICAVKISGYIVSFHPGSVLNKQKLLTAEIIAEFNAIHKNIMAGKNGTWNCQQKVSEEYDLVL